MHCATHFRKTSDWDNPATNHKYGWWLRSCTTQDVESPLLEHNKHHIKHLSLVLCCQPWVGFQGILNHPSSDRSNGLVLGAFAGDAISTGDGVPVKRLGETPPDIVTSSPSWRTSAKRWVGNNANPLIFSKILPVLSLNNEMLMEKILKKWTIYFSSI